VGFKNYLFDIKKYQILFL